MHMKLHYITHHYATLITPHHNCNFNCATLITLHYNYNLQLQLHYTRLQLQVQLHYTTQHPAVVVRWPLTTPKNATPTTFQSISGFTLPSMSHNNQPPYRFPAESIHGPNPQISSRVGRPVWQAGPVGYHFCIPPSNEKIRARNTGWVLRCIRSIQFGAPYSTYHLRDIGLDHFPTTVTPPAAHPVATGQKALGRSRLRSSPNCCLAKRSPGGWL